MAQTLTSSSELVARARAWAEGTLHAYATILFSRSALVAGLILGATVAGRPVVGLHGLAAAALANAVALAMGFDREVVRTGVYGYNALFLGLGIGALWVPSAMVETMLAAGTVATVLMVASLRSSATAQLGLPVLTWPFVIGYSLLTLAGQALGLESAPASASWDVALPSWLSAPAAALGSLFYVAQPAAGLLIWLAAAISSRIGAMLLLTGFGVAQGIVVASGGLAPHMDLLLASNAMFGALAVGGIWFVPSRSSFALAAFASLTAALAALALRHPMGLWGLSPGILPFNLVAWVLLLAMRQRVLDGSPKSVDFVPGSPEENLQYFKTRLERWGSRYVVRIQVPALGRWVCTQGVDGAESHRDVWRHAFDFEALGPDARLHRGDGLQPADYYCWRAPVVAPAAATVISVVDGVPDNPIGRMNVEKNWGNLVVLQLGPGLYCLLAHFAQGSLRVAPGQSVAAGAVLGLCGNSGRSARPHIHMHLQATARVGAPTIHIELHDVVAELGGGDVWHPTVVADKGGVYRNVTPDPGLAERFRMPYAVSLTWASSTGATETIAADVDVHGRSLLISESAGTLSYDLSDQRFIALDALAPTDSVLHWLRFAAPRISFDDQPGVTWSETLPTRFLLGPLGRLAHDLVSPFVSTGGERLRMWVEREAGGVIRVRGESHKRAADGTPAVSTCVTTLPSGVAAVEARLVGQTVQWWRSDLSGAGESLYWR